MSHATSPRREAVAAGIAWMLLNTLFMVFVTGIVRYVGTELPSSQAVFIRYCFGLALLLPWFGYFLRHLPSRKSLTLYATRGIMHGISVSLWFYAMARIPIAEVTALGYVTPIFVTLGAVYFFGEKLHLRRAIAIGVGLFGALIILRPGFQELSTGQLAQLLAAPGFALSYLIAKRLSATESPIVMVMMLTFMTVPVLAPGAILSWQTPSWSDVAWLALTAIFATASHYAVTRAIQAAPLSVTQPVVFLQLVWASILGIVVFDEPVDPFVIAGGGIVVAAITFISQREARRSRQQITPPPSATKY